MGTIGLPNSIPNSYRGPPVNLVPIRSITHEPTTTDKKFPVGQFVILSKDPSTGSEGELWYLSKFVAGDPVWVQFSVTPGSPGIDTITTDAGAPAVEPNSVTGNVNILGGTGITTVGQGPGSTVTINLDANIALSYPTDSGTAIPAANALSVLGGIGLNSTGAGAVVTINLDVPVIVDNGGTGRISHTAYAVICGGTTSTAAQQSIASVGTSQQVLTSRGAAQLPIMANPVTSVLASASANNSSTIEFLNLPNTNGLYFFSVTDYRPATNNVTFFMDMSSDGGATWAAAGFQSTLLYNAYNDTTNVVASSTASVVLGDALSGGGTSNCGSCFFYFSEVGNAISTLIGQTTFTGQANIMQHGRIGSYVPVSPANVNFNSFRFRMSSGNITIGDFTVYKVLQVAPV